MHLKKKKIKGMCTHSEHRLSFHKIVLKNIVFYLKIREGLGIVSSKWINKQTHMLPF